MSVPPDQLMAQLEAVMVCRGHSPMLDMAFTNTLRCPVCTAMGWIETDTDGTLRLAGMGTNETCASIARRSWLLRQRSEALQAAKR